MAAQHLESTRKKDNEKTVGDLTAEIQETRLKICNAFLITIAILAIPALSASLYRITEIGWKPIMAVHIIIAISLWAITLFRSRVPYHFQAGFIVVTFFIIGLGGIYQFGLVAGGIAFLVASSPIATLLFGARTGIAILFLSLCGAAAIGSLTVSGNVKHGLDLTSYAIAPSSWLTSIFSWILASTALTVSLHVFNKNLINTLKISRQHQEALRNHQLSLEKSIEEKEQALNEIKILKGIIPICSYCHSIRDDEGAWDMLEEYLSKHSYAEFSHGICPKCLSKVRSEAGLDET